jgi:hypothetical protein
MTTKSAGNQLKYARYGISVPTWEHLEAMKIEGGPIRYAQDKALEELLGRLPRIEDRSGAKFFYSVNSWEKKELKQVIKEFKSHPSNILVVEVSL